MSKTSYLRGERSPQSIFSSYCETTRKMIYFLHAFQFRVISSFQVLAPVPYPAFSIFDELES